MDAQDWLALSLLGAGAVWWSVRRAQARDRQPPPPPAGPLPLVTPGVAPAARTARANPLLELLRRRRLAQPAPTTAPTSTLAPVDLSRIPARRETPAAQPAIVVLPDGRRVRNRLEYDGLFVREGRRVGLPPLLLKAIAMVESNLNPRAANNDEPGGRRSLGLMQVATPRGGRYGGPLGGTWGDRLRPPGGDEQLFDPAFNVAVGAEVLQSFVKRHGLGPRAIAAYNDGRGRADVSRYDDLVLSAFQQLSGGPLA